jgi:hypothetical protein
MKVDRVSKSSFGIEGWPLSLLVFVGIPYFSQSIVIENHSC